MTSPQVTEADKAKAEEVCGDKLDESEGEYAACQFPRGHKSGHHYEGLPSLGYRPPRQPQRVRCPCSFCEEYRPAAAIRADP